MARSSEAYGGAVKVVACIEDPVVIEKILTHLKEKAVSVGAGLLPASGHCLKQSHFANRQEIY